MNNNYTKGILHVNIAKQYLEGYLVDKPSKRAEQVTKSFINKLNFIENSAYAETNEEGREAFRNEIRNGDTLYFDAMYDKFLDLTKDQRELLEAIVDGMIRGEEIVFSN